MTLVRGTRYIKKNMVKNKFAFAFNKSVEVSLNVQKTAIPGITLGSQKLANPFIDRPVYNTKPEYDDLTIEFVVDDVMNTWGMINDWMRAYAPVDSTFDNTLAERTEFDSLRRELPNVYDYKNLGTAKKDGDLYDIASLIVNNSGNVAEVEIKFHDIFPVSLSELPLDIGADSDELVICTAKFKYWYYTVHRRGEI